MDYKEPLISIIIPVYNVEKYLNRCLDSVVNQTYKNLEIICVDDGSPDNCGKICDEFAGKDLRIKVIHQENEGQSKARNTGLDCCEGEYVSFVDSDDFIHKDYIKSMYELITKYECDIVQTDYVVGTGNSFSGELENNIEESLIDKYKALSGFAYKVSPCMKLYKRDMFLGIRFPIGFINEDDATYYKIAYNASKICISNAKLYYYFQSNNSTMRNVRKPKMDFLKIYDERIKFFEEKNEKFLLDKSYERYAIVLMLNYAGFAKKGADKQQFDEIFKKFKEIYPQSLKGSAFKYKPLLFLFRFFPDLTAKMIRIVRK